jgi:uncharacterized protein (DUF608 family)
MICLDGMGAFTHVSLRHKPAIDHAPRIFAGVHARRAGSRGVARVVEGPVPLDYGYADHRTTDLERLYGLPRFSRISFEQRFPFAEVSLEDDDVPLAVRLTAFNPFVPNDADASSLPVAGLEYRFTNTTTDRIDVVFSFHAKNFMKIRSDGQRVEPVASGFLLHQDGRAEAPWEEGGFSVRSSDPETRVDCQWFRGDWFDEGTVLWRRIATGDVRAHTPYTDGDRPSPGASLYVPFSLAPGEERTVRVQLAWYVPRSDLREGQPPTEANIPISERSRETHYVPWYAVRFTSLRDVSDYFFQHHDELREKSARFSSALHRSTLPAEVREAVTSNLSILKSTTVLRQHDGRFWAWEGSADMMGSCHGTCQHVWNYAQAMAHLFPALERGIRETEHDVCMNDRGHQEFRTPLPIRTPGHTFHAAADGQLGGVIKVYREWRISGSRDWLARIWPQVRRSLDFAIETWDPRRTGALEEPQHNTYDIEFWGPNGMLTSFYASALEAAVRMGSALGDKVEGYADLRDKAVKRLEGELFDGEYFIQSGDRPRASPAAASGRARVSPEASALFEREGPKYQYGAGCLSDGVLGFWIAQSAGLPEIVDRKKIESHLVSVYRHNFRADLTGHANPQRPRYALPPEAGLLLCTWPKGGALTLPFPYSDEVWTGIEYQVACHLISYGHVEQGLSIVRAARLRYDGRYRNPFDEYECGRWYARALASYGLLAAFSGARYDAVERVLYLHPKLPGDFEAFLCTATGYGTVGVRNGKPFLEITEGEISAERIDYTAYAPPS